MITQLGEIEVEPQPSADYRPLFETTPLNVAHVRVWPGETVPARVQGDEHQVSTSCPARVSSSLVQAPRR